MALLSIANLGFSYGDRRILDGVNLTLNGGEHVGLLGQNGCGKSTLMKIILGTGALKPDAGQFQVARGSTAGYRALRSERYEFQQRAFDKQQTKIRQEQAFIDRCGAGQRARQADREARPGGHTSGRG